MAQTIQEALSSASLYTDEVDYKLVKLSAKAIMVAAGILAEAAEPFSTVIVDKDEVTLVLRAELVEEFADRLEKVPDYEVSQIDYRLITLDVILEPTLVGLMATISTALAEAKISILPMAAFSRDHLLIAANQLDDALQTLRTLQA